MNIDAHRHYWRYQAQEYPWITDELALFQRDFLPEDSHALDRALGIDGVIAVQARTHEVENSFLQELAQRSNIVGIVGWVDLCAERVDERLAYYREQPLMRGFRHLVQDEPNPRAFWAYDHFNRGISALQRHGFVYDVLVRQADLSAAVDFCARHDQALLVLDHLGKPDFRDFAAWEQQMQRLARLEHVAVKISGLLLEAGAGSDAQTVAPYVESALTLFGAERCMLGSDDPVCLLSHERAALVAWWQGVLAGLSAAEQSALAGLTAKRVYGV